MIIAVVIEDQNKLSIGSCLSDASVFMIYNSKTRSKEILPLPFCGEKEMKSKCYSHYLKEHLVDLVMARDLGPKAKSNLNELNIDYSSKMEHNSVESIISYINKNTKR